MLVLHVAMKMLKLLSYKMTVVHRPQTVKQVLNTIVGLGHLCLMVFLNQNYILCLRSMIYIKWTYKQSKQQMLVYKQHLCCS
jgi:hypothetical protein